MEKLKPKWVQVDNLKQSDGQPPLSPMSPRMTEYALQQYQEDVTEAINREKDNVPESNTSRLKLKKRRVFGRTSREPE